MSAVAEIIPTIIHVTVVRRTDNKLRFTIYENNAVADLTGDTITFLAKDEPGGAVKSTVVATLEDQTGALRGQCTAVVPKADLGLSGYPNDSPTTPAVWVYQVRRLHAGLLSVVIEGDLTLRETI